MAGVGVDSRRVREQITAAQIRRLSDLPTPLSDLFAAHLKCRPSPSDLLGRRGHPSIPVMPPSPLRTSLPRMRVTKKLTKCEPRLALHLLYTRDDTAHKSWKDGKHNRIRNPDGTDSRQGALRSRIPRPRQYISSRLSLDADTWLASSAFSPRANPPKPCQSRLPRLESARTIRLERRCGAAGPRYRPPSASIEVT